MATQHPIYIIKPRALEQGKEPLPRLVRAPNGPQALRHVASEYSGTRASQDDLVAAIGAGVKVEDATTDAVTA